MPTLRSSEPIPGYTVKERIGAGGYGEVWTAEAPGGLIKAIKFVYGYLDDDRASRELKALNRIKQVRHPFLLSLERIEVVDGQLMIVTELAEMSLKDRFEQCRGDGLPGIPRDELLIYLRDAADALDYMSVSHSLQHLDVKPENLLLVGGRVKVADFGLVKDIGVTGFADGRPDARLRSAGSVRRPPRRAQRSVQPGDRLSGNADRRAAVPRQDRRAARHAAFAEPAAAGLAAAARSSRDRTGAVQGRGRPLSELPRR